MHVSCSGQWYAIPDPVAGVGERAIRVQKYGVIPRPSRKLSSSPVITSPFAKLVYFLWHEGPLTTFQKVKAVQLREKINRERQLVFVYGEDAASGHSIIALGPQACAGSDLAIFPEPFCMTVECDRDVTADFATLINLFRQQRDLFLAAFFYSSLSGTEPPFSLKLLLDKKGGNSRVYQLETVTTPTFANAVPSSRSTSRERFPLFLAGAGCYSYTYILHALRGFRKHTVIDINPVAAAVVGKKFGFLFPETSSDRALSVLESCESPLLVIATFHSTHLDIAELALSSNRNVKILIEKPPVTTRAQLERLIALREQGAYIEIGFNRRYTRFSQIARKILSKNTGPITMTCVVREISIPPAHWYYWPSQGTRITGNICHWLDLATFFIRSRPVGISLVSTANSPAGDEISAVISYKDGSRLTLVASDRGSSLLGVQEQIELRQEQTTILIDDFIRMKVLNAGKQSTHRSFSRDRGHARMYREFARRVRQDTPPRYPTEDILVSTSLYLILTNMAQQGLSEVQIDPETCLVQ